MIKTKTSKNCDRKILPRHGCISINQQFTATMENNFAGKQLCSLSYTGAWER